MAKFPRNKRTFRTGEQETSFVVDTANMYSSERNLDGSLKEFAGAGAEFDAIVRKVTATLKSATDSIQFTGSANKTIDTSTGRERQPFFVKSDSAQYVEKAVDYKQGKYEGNNQFASLGLDASVSNLAVRDRQWETLQTTRQIVGKENRALLEQLAEERGFSVDYSKQKGYEDFATITWRGESAKIARYEQEHKAYEQARRNGQLWAGDKDARLTAESRLEKETGLADIFKKSGKALREQEKSEEEERLAKVSEQNDKYGEKYTHRHRKYSDLVKDKDSLTPDELLSQYKDIEKKDRAEQQGEAEQREKNASSRKVIGNIAKVIAVVTMLADIARRILTAVLDATTKARSDSIQSNAVGVTYTSKIGFDRVDRAHGMTEGTTFNAIADLQSKFGDVTNLDEKSLGILARVMGNDVSQMVRSGTGGDTPDKLLSNILNKYFDSFRQGRNSLGQYVGQEQAMRELTTSLKEVSPAIAEVFSTMAVQWRTGTNKGAFGTWEEFQGTTRVNRAGLTDTERANFVMLGDVVNQTRDIFKQFVEDNLLAKLANSLSGVISKLEDSRVGESAGEKIEHNKTNREKLQRSLEVDEERKMIDKMVYATALESSAYSEFSDVSLEDIKKYYKADASMLSVEEGEKARKVQSLLSRSALSEDQSMFSAIGQYLATDARIEETNRQLSKKYGDVEYLEGKHTDEGKAQTDRKMMLSLRDGIIDAYGMSDGANITDRINQARNGSTVDLSRMDGYTVEFIKRSMKEYYSQQGELFQFDEEGNASINSNSLGKSWRGNYDDQQLKEIVENFNAVVGKSDRIEKSIFGGITEGGMEQLLSILEGGASAIKNHTDEDGTVDYKALREDRSYQLYEKLRNAEVAGFADLATSAGFGKKLIAAKDFTREFNAQTDRLQEQAEALTSTNSSLTSVKNTVEEIRRLVENANAKNGERAVITRSMEAGSNTVKVHLTMLDKFGKTVFDKDLADETLTSGASKTRVVSQEISLGVAQSLLSQ